MRPTGRLHIGHYFGALANWIRMQAEYDCFYFVADWHALTTHYADTSEVAQNTLEIITDWLAAGLDPTKCTIFVQSQVPEHAELHLLLSMVTPLELLERVPTYKEQLEQIKDKDLHTYGFLGYPLLQAADIVIYDADCVPVGGDQVPHVELAREIVRRFNFFYGFKLRGDLTQEQRMQVFNHALPNLAVGYYSKATSSDVEFRLLSDVRQIGIANFLEKMGEFKNFFRVQTVLREPSAMLTETPRFPGTDGRRMAKSYDNAIWLSEDDNSIREKVRGMMTDPQRVRREDPGRPEVCPVFAYHKLFSTPETIAWSEQGCRTAGIGCVECKSAMAEGLIKWITPFRERRQEYEAQPKKVWAIAEEGSRRARQVARRTMRRVREAIFAWERARKGWNEAAPQAQPAAAPGGSSQVAGN